MASYLRRKSIITPPLRACSAVSKSICMKLACAGVAGQAVAALAWFSTASAARRLEIETDALPGCKRSSWRPGVRLHQRMERGMAQTTPTGTRTQGPSVRQERRPPSLKTRLEAGEKLYGAFMVSFSTVIAEILGYGGYDYVVVDMEHGPGDVISALPVLQTLAGTGTPAILRLPYNDPVLVKKALDVGPAGLMFPMIEDAEAARTAVAASRYPPRGIRGAAASIVRASRYGLDESYLEHCEEELFIMCQVESTEAVEKIPEIAGVEGVDCLMMGPTDLRASLGLLRSPEDERPEELLRKAEQAVLASKRKVFLAGFATPQDPPPYLFEHGYDMVSGAVDVALFKNAVVEDLKKNRQTPRGS